MTIKWNEVTSYSKIIALILFILLPFAGFYFGMHFEKQLLISEGSLDTTVWTPGMPQMKCGGFIQGAKTCPAGYHCQLGSIPDKGGTCAKD